MNGPSALDDTSYVNDKNPIFQSALEFFTAPLKGPVRSNLIVTKLSR